MRGPRPKGISRGLERRYAQDLGLVSHSVSKAIARALRGEVEGLRLDADGIDLGGVHARLGVLRARFTRTTRSSRMRSLVDRYGRAINGENLEDMERILPISLAAEPPVIQSTLAAFSRSNVNLITSIATNQLDQVEALVRAAATSGVRHETLSKQILERFRVSRSRADLIARDQILKANSALTQARHREAGITKYVWSTSRDEKVRDRHVDLEGITFDWVDPPPSGVNGEPGHPGEPIQCRCVPIPVLP